MAYVKPTDLDGFITQMGKSDVRIKTQLAEDLVNYLSDYENSLICSDLGFLVDALMPWLTGSHFKVRLVIKAIRVESRLDSEGMSNSALRIFYRAAKTARKHHQNATPSSSWST